jgi:hypothetical protein
MPDNHDNESSRGDYRRGYYDKYGKWVEHQDIGIPRAYRGPMGQGIVFAVLMIAAGVFLFLDNIGLFHFHDVWRFWPVALIAIGVAKLADCHGLGGRLWALMLIVVGASFLLNNLGIWHVGWNLIWPLGLIGFGLLLLVHALEHHNHPASAYTVPGSTLSGSNPSTSTAPNPGPSDMSSPENTLREWVTFGGVKRRLDTQNFLGGEAVAVFGGIEIDLRRANIASGTKDVMIDANSTFGGIEIRVPDNWRVITRGIGIFGGYEDKTIPPRAQDAAEAPRLIVKGYALFGGVSIEN